MNQSLVVGQMGRIKVPRPVVMTQSLRTDKKLAHGLGENKKGQHQ